MATVQIRKENLTGIKDLDSLLSTLNDKYSGKWVAILQNGEIIADSDLQKVYDAAANKSSKIVTLFQASKESEQLFL